MQNKKPIPDLRNERQQTVMKLLSKLNGAEEAIITGDEWQTIDELKCSLEGQIYQTIQSIAEKSTETYERELAQAKLYQKLSEAEVQLEERDSLLDAEAVFQKLRDKYFDK